MNSRFFFLFPNGCPSTVFIDVSVEFCFLCLFRRKRKGDEDTKQDGGGDVELVAMVAIWQFIELAASTAVVGTLCVCSIVQNRMIHSCLLFY